MNGDDLDERLDAYGQRWRDTHQFAAHIDTASLARVPRGKRVVAIAAVMVAIAVVVGVAVAIGRSGTQQHNRIVATPSTPSTSSPPTTAPIRPLPSTAPPVDGTTDLPVVGCPTDMAITSLPVHPIAPPSGLPTDMHARLAIYSDVTGVLVVVAPRGWSCAALLGADGSGHIAVYPPDGPPPDVNGEPLPSAQAITARTDGGCAGCTAVSVCTLLPDAPLVQAAMPAHCTDPPPRETVTRLGTNAAAFQDPAGYPGTGKPSGGPYPANGVAILQTAHDLTRDWIVTCTLPDDQHNVCTAVLNEFVARYPPTS